MDTSRATPADGSNRPTQPDTYLPTVADAMDLIVTAHYPGLIGALHACLAVAGSMALTGRTKPLCLILETPSGYGKTAVIQMLFPCPTNGLAKYIYRSDKFSPKSFVSHAANVKKSQLASVDLLPRLKHKVLLTKELAPLFRGREDEMQESFSILISVLDGKGFTSDSGIHGQRGYEQAILFNWIGATTPLPPSTHRLMSQLGTRLLFYEVPAITPSEEELVAYARNDQADTAERECQQAVNEFLIEFFRARPIGSIPADSIVFSDQQLQEIVRWARLLVAARAEVSFERAGTAWEAVAAMPAEGPWKVVNYFKDLARGHALIHGRTEIDLSDLELIAQIALSSIPGGLRPIVRALRESRTVVTANVRTLCRVSDPTARSYLKQLALLGIVDLFKSPDRRQHYTAAFASEYHWLNPDANWNCLDSLVRWSL